MKIRNGQKQNVVWQQIREEQNVIHTKQRNQEAKDEVEGLVTPVSTIKTTQKAWRQGEKGLIKKNSCVLEVKKLGKKWE